MGGVSLGEEFGDEFAELQKEFLDTTRERLVKLREFLDAALEGEAGEKFRLIAHSLRGCGGSYGYSNISAAAEAVEKAYNGKEALETLETLVATLEETVAGCEPGQEY